MNLKIGMPSPQSPGTLGIDIGSRTIKIVAARESSGHLEIRAASSTNLPEGLVENGIILDPQKAGKFISAGLAEFGEPVSSAVFSVPSSLAALRWVALPNLPTEELREAARFKVRRHLPFPAESAYIEASAPNSGSGDGDQSLVIAVRREVIDSRAEALESAGLTPIAAELEAQAILRVVERRLSDQSALWRDATLTIIDLGATFTHMYVVQNQRLQFIRGVRFGSDRIAASLARRLEIPKLEAEQYLTHPETCLTPDGTVRLRTGDIVVQVDITSEIEKLTKEFLRLLRYFRSLHPERSYAGILDHILVCGGLAGLKGLSEYLAASLGLRVELARPFGGMVAQLSQETFESTASRQEAFTVVVGLALSGLRRESRPTGESSARNEFNWARSA